MRCPPKRMSFWFLSKFFDGSFGGDEGRDVVLEDESPLAAALDRPNTFKPYFLSILDLRSKQSANSENVSTFQRTSSRFDFDFIQITHKYYRAAALTSKMRDFLKCFWLTQVKVQEDADLVTASIFHRCNNLRIFRK